MAGACHYRKRPPWRAKWPVPSVRNATEGVPYRFACCTKRGRAKSYSTPLVAFMHKQREPLPLVGNAFRQLETGESLY